MRVQLPCGKRQILGGNVATQCNLMEKCGIGLATTAKQVQFGIINGVDSKESCIRSAYMLVPPDKYG